MTTPLTITTHDGAITVSGAPDVVGVEVASDLLTITLTSVGVPGATGPAGAAGADGADGSPGADGQDGAPGATGPQGPQGDTGPTGATGTQGPQGDAGAAGATGATGPAGPDGPTGPTGATGPAASLSTATLTLATAQYGHAAVIIADLAASPASLVLCQLAPNDDHDADDLADYGLTALCDTDAITFTLHRDGPMVGSYAVTYTLG